MYVQRKQMMLKSIGKQPLYDSTINDTINLPSMELCCLQM